MSASCDPETITGIAEFVLREDITGLARGFSVEERLEFWNEIRGEYMRYIRECARYFDKDVDRLIRGKLRLAQLLIAASFKVNGEEIPEVTGKFSDEEYRVIFDLEDLKEIEYLSVSDLVEFIERREGKVYEVVKKYYERGYYMLDTKWTNMIGTLALALAERYKEARRKIEEAVIRYIRKKPLTLFIGEIEEAVVKALEAGEARRKAEATITRAREEAVRLEPVLETTRGSPEGVKAREDALDRLESLIRELEEEKKRLREKERLLEVEAEKYRGDAKAREVLEAELEALRARLRELEELVEEYKGSIALLRAEKEALQERYEALRRSLEGGSRGNLVSREEAWALENALVERVVRNLRDGVEIYDPGKGEVRRVKWSKTIYYSLHGDSKPSGKGVQLVLMKGVLRKRRDIVVDAVSIVHADAFAEKGWDDQPVGLGEVMELVESRLAEAGEKGYYHMMIIGSPTGFTEKAIRFVENPEYGINLASKHLTLYLVDLVKGRVYYSRGDPVAEANRSLAEPMLPEEKVRKVIDYVLSTEAKRKALANSMSTPFLLVEEIAEATGEGIEVVLRALSRLEEQNAGRVRVTSSGVTAFFYPPL